MVELLMKCHNMKTIIIILLCSVPLLSQAQNCPKSVRKSGYVIIPQSKTSDTLAPLIKSGKLIYPAEPYDIRIGLRFVPSDSISAAKPLSYWIKKGENFPAIYVLWEERGLRRVLKDLGCDKPFVFLDPVGEGIQPEVRKEKLKFYQMDEAENQHWYYQIYFLDAQWQTMELSEELKKNIGFGNRMVPPVPAEGNTSFFALEKVLTYTTDTYFKDQRLREYKIK